MSEPLNIREAEEHARGAIAAGLDMEVDHRFLALAAAYREAVEALAKVVITASAHPELIGHPATLGAYTASRAVLAKARTALKEN